jgi:hypothetical protein
MAAVPPGEQLELLAASLARARGEDFFPVLAEHLGSILGAREASVGLLMWAIAWTALVVALAARRLRRTDF